MVEGTGSASTARKRPRARSRWRRRAEEALETDKSHVFLVDVRPEAERKLASIAATSRSSRARSTT